MPKTAKSSLGKVGGVRLEPMGVKMVDPSYYFDPSSPSFPSVTAYLNNFAVGRQATPASPFYSQMDRAQVLDLGLGHIRGWTDTPIVQAYEFRKMSKYGPQGELLPLSAPENVDLFRMYYQHTTTPCKIPSAIMTRMKRKYSEADLVPWTYEQVVNRALSKGTYGTQAGAPSFGKKKHYYPQAIKEAQNGGLGERDVLVIGGRAIRQGHRFIYMASQSTTLRELRWILPLQEWLTTRGEHYLAWKGQKFVEQGVTKWNSGKKTFISTDYTKMDTTCGPNQYVAFYEMTKWAWPKRLWPEYKQDILHAINVPVIVGSVRIPGSSMTKNEPARKKATKLVAITGSHSNFSGDAWNQTLETVLADTNWEEMSMRGYADDWQIIGDDGTGLVDGVKPLDTMAEVFSEISRSRGFNVNTEKQEASYDTFTYLQRQYSAESFRNNTWYGSYPLVLALNSAKNPERDNVTGRPRADELRTLSYLSIVENMYGNPHFHEAIEIFARGDPLHLGCDDPALWEDDALYQSARERGILHLSAGSTLPPKLSQFRTVQYLRARC